MPMPGWWRHLNKRFFNPRTLKTDHNWSLITHVGRKSGTTFTTPVEAIPVRNGFVTYLMYGRNTDWAKNVLASNSGSIEKDGQHHRIHATRIVAIDDIAAELPADVAHPPAILRVKEAIWMVTTPV